MSATFPKLYREGVLAREGGVGGVNWTVHLFSNPTLTISDDTVLTDIVECNYSGYAPVSAGGWTDSATDVNRITHRDSPDLLFTCAGGMPGNNVFGHYVTWTDGVTTALVLVQKFRTPFAMFLATDTIPLRVTIRLRQGF